jgi:A/G-specific adenine glycosylase
VSFPAEPLLAWYAAHGRTHLPWRNTRDPYRVAVSEFMLQQTQVERVLPLFAAFLERFPSLEALAKAPLAEVVRAWKGLGYNSRAVRLHRFAQAVVERYDGHVPRAAAALLDLPGIGPYTAAALRAFAFDEDDVALDTNLRRVIHRVVFGFEHPPKANDAELDRVARTAIPPGRAHDINSALMDLGATICTSRVAKCLVCPLRDMCAAAPIDATQLASAVAARALRKSPQERIAFEQSDRFLRGRIVDRLRDLSPEEAISLLDLQRDLKPFLSDDRVTALGPAIEKLRAEGILESIDGHVRLAG